MSAPYYADECVTLFLGDCREVTAWLDADVLVTDPPYGRGWRTGAAASHSGGGARRAKPPIANDHNTDARDAALTMWGNRPAVCFGDLLLQPPAGTRRVLIYKKPPDAGVIGAGAGFRRDVEAVYIMGVGWPTGGIRSAVLTTGARGMSGTLTTPTGHPHTKPRDVMELLIRATVGGTVADPFTGSGTTLVAAKAVGRSAVGVEIEERYCEIAARRLSQGVLDFGASA